MSERQYAAHAGITRGAVSKARLFGRLVLHSDGSIDVASPTSAAPAPPIRRSSVVGRRRTCGRCRKPRSVRS